MVHNQMFYLGNYSVVFTPEDENGYREMITIQNEPIHLTVSNKGYEILINLINDYDNATNSDEADRAKYFFEYITGIERGWNDWLN